MNTLTVLPDSGAFARAAALLKSGELVAMPTETVYGLAADACSSQAVRRIFEAKGRPQDNPLIVHIAGMEMLDQVWQRITPQARALAEAFWPGALTIILPRARQLADEVCAGLPTAAVRWPDHPVAQKLIEAAGVPLAAPSANRSGSPSPTTAQAVQQDLAGRIPLILDGGACAVGVESTVVSLAEAEPLLLRPGQIACEQLSAVLGCRVRLSPAVLHQLEQGQAAPSPGMKYRHYSPRAKLILVKGSAQAYAAYVNQQLEQGVFALCFDEMRAVLQGSCVCYGPQTQPAQQARQLFAALRTLDAQGAQLAYVQCPDCRGIGLAVYNRLLRAAGFQVLEL